MAWQTYNTNVVSKVFSSKLCAKTYLVCFLQQFLLKVDVAESRFFSADVPPITKAMW